MLKRNIIFLFSVLAVSGSLNAQVRPGIKMGYNLSGVMADYRGNKPPKELQWTASDPRNFHMRSGFQAGLIADCPINDALATQPGARFSMQGFYDKYKNGSDHGAPNELRSFSLYYLQIPVYVQYRWNVYEETNVVFQAGPYAGYGLFGRQSRNRSGSSIDLADSEKKITFGVDNDIQAIDYGIGAGVGIEFFRFQLIVAYDFGLNKMTFDKLKAGSVSYHVDMQNHNFSVTFGVIFGRRDPLQNQRD